MHNVMLLGSALDNGGAERVIANLARHLDSRRFNVTVCHLVEPRGPIGDELARDGHEVVGVKRDERGFRRYLSSRALMRVVRDRRIDLIHSHTHYSLTDAALCSLATGRRLKVLHTFHFGNYPHLPGRYLLMERLGSRLAHTLVAVGREQQRLVTRTHGLRPTDVTVVPNGVEPLDSPVDDEWRTRLQERGAVVIGTICTFIEQKGLPDLLKVAAALKRTGTNAVFVVVGDGVLRASIEAECRRMDLTGHVLFTGMKPAASGSMLPLFDIFFQSSLWEAMSMVVLEAMAAGKPIVATDVGDNRHVVRHGEAGYIVPRGDVEAMASALRTIVASPDVRRTMGDAGRRRHAELYTVDAMARRYEQLYLDLLPADGRAPIDGSVSGARQVNPHR